MNLSKYNFKHTGLMQNSMQSIPIGNGDLGANIWANNGGVFLLLSKTDAWSENLRLLKTGLLYLKLSDNPFDNRTEWQLSYEEGILYINAKDAKLEIYVNANYPSYHFCFSSATPRTAELSIINYRDKDLHIPQNDHSNYHLYTQNAFVYDGIESADVIFSRTANSIGQYHHNNDSCYEFTLKHQGLEAFADKNDPMINRTFGFLASSDNMSVKGNGLVGEKLTEFNINIVSLTDICGSEEWLNAIYELNNNLKPDKSAHKAYWAEIGTRSWIEIEGDQDSFNMTKSYIAQRYITICAGRGASPIKFNGSIFTNQPSEYVTDRDNYDYRLWGGPYWFQNSRLVYWSMLYQGDYELMKPFFKMYIDALPLGKYQTEAYFGHKGAFFPETMTMFGTFTNNDYGVYKPITKPHYVDNPYVRYHFEGVIELCQMMLLYIEHTNDLAFLENEFFGFSFEILTFFREHFEVKEGKLYIYPTSALETWQDCINDTPTVAGLKAVTEGILAFNNLPEDLKALCNEFKDILPLIPLCEKEGKKVIAPFGDNLDEVIKNCENPELYAIFPFFCYGLGKDDIETARNTFMLRGVKNSCGWQQHGIQAALLGLSDEAEKEIINNMNNTNANCIFPAFWGPNYDWLPDQDNGANLNMTIINALVQSNKEEIRILPAWNKKRDVRFRLPVGDNNFIEVEFINGELKDYKLDKPTNKKVII